ncbi:MAG: hypothetical protein PVI75_03185 [Gammaproteobacteria bacterium]|jgi:hypothetical protein
MFNKKKEQNIETFEITEKPKKPKQKAKDKTEIIDLSDGFWLTFLSCGHCFGLSIIVNLLNTWRLLLTMIIHPAQFKKFESNTILDSEIYSTKKKKYLLDGLMKLTKISIEAEEISRKQKNITKNITNDEMHLIIIPGNVASAFQFRDHAQKYIDSAKKHKISLIVHLINPRGVGNPKFLNKAYSSNIIVDDYVRIILHEIKKNGGKEKSYKFAIAGYSLGGAFATKITAKLHNLGYFVQLINIKSFAKLAEVINIHIKRIKKSLSKHCLKYLLPNKLLLTTTLYCANWSLNVTKQYKKIPIEYKTHVVVKEDKNKNNKNPYKTTGSEADGVIPYSSSIHRSLKSKRKEFVAYYKKLRHTIENYSGENIQTSPLLIKLDKIYNNATKIDNIKQLITKLKTEFSTISTTSVIKIDTLKTNICNRLDKIKYWYTDAMKFKRDKKKLLTQKKEFLLNNWKIKYDDFSDYRKFFIRLTNTYYNEISYTENNSSIPTIGNTIINKLTNQLKKGKKGTEKYSIDEYVKDLLQILDNYEKKCAPKNPGFIWSAKDIKEHKTSIQDIKFILTKQLHKLTLSKGHVFDLISLVPYKERNNMPKNALEYIVTTMIKKYKYIKENPKKKEPTKREDSRTFLKKCKTFM